jgi:hypothetical protein
MDDRLERRLHALAPDVAFPPTPDLRAAVAQRLAAPPGRGWLPRSLPRAVSLALIATLLLAAGAAALVLLVPGLRVTVVPSLPSADVRDDPLATRLALGAPIDPAAVGVGLPSELGAPDEAYVLGDEEVLTLVYGAGDGLPDLAGSGIGLLVQRIDGALDRERVEKLVVEVGADVRPVEVRGERGFWISGAQHLIRYSTATDPEREQPTRLVGDALVWERDGVLYRVESGLGLDATLRIAESIDR